MKALFLFTYSICLLTLVVLLPDALRHAFTEGGWLHQGFGMLAVSVLSVIGAVCVRVLTRD